MKVGNDNALYAKIKEARYSVNAFSKELGMSNGALISKLCGETDWKLLEVVAACKLLGITIDQFVKLRR